MSRNTGASRASSSAVKEPRRMGVPSESNAFAFSSVSTSATISLSPLLAARRCLLRRCSTLAMSAITNSSSSAARSPSGSGTTPPSANARSTIRIASQFRSVPRVFEPSPSPGFEPGGSARCASSKPAATVFFDFDISVRRRRRSSGRLATPTAASYSLGTGRPVRALNRRLAPAPVKPTRPRFSIGAQATDRVASNPL